MNSHVIRVLVCAGICVAGLAAPAAAHPGQPSSVFDPNVVGWASYRNYLPAAFDTLVAQQAQAGRIPVDIDADASGGGYVMAGVFQSNLDNRPWRLLHGLTEAQFEAANRDVNTWRLIDLEAFVTGGVRRYAAVWVAANFAPFGWDFYHNVTRARLDEVVTTLRGQGFLPVDIDEYQIGAEMRYDVIFARNGENLAWSLARDLTGGEFHAVFEALRPTHRPLVADSTPSPNGQRYSAIWVENRNHRGWTILRDLTVDAWAAAWQEQLDAGNRVVGFERYQTSSGTRYLGIWRQNLSS